MRGFRLAFIAMLVGVLAVPFAISGVSAQPDTSASDGSRAADMNPNCFVSGAIEGSGGYDPAASGGVYTVPIAGSASYDGGVIVDVPDEGREISGAVSVALPLGFSVGIRDWSDDDATGTTANGDVTWDLPDATPRGVPMTVSGFHNESGSPYCDGSISVKLEGGLLDSATGLVTAAITVITGVLTALTGIPSRP